MLVTVARFCTDHFLALDYAPFSRELVRMVACESADIFSSHFMHFIDWTLPLFFELLWSLFTCVGTEVQCSDHKRTYTVFFIQTRSKFQDCGLHSLPLVQKSVFNAFECNMITASSTRSVKNIWQLGHITAMYSRNKKSLPQNIPQIMLSRISIHWEC